MNKKINKQSIAVLFLLLQLLIFLTACQPSPPSKNKVLHYKLTIAFSKPVGKEASGFPEDIKNLMNYHQSKTCNDLLFIPDVSLVRLDSTEIKMEEMDLGKDQNNVEKALGKPIDPEVAKKKRSEGITKSLISSTLANAETAPNAVSSSLENLKSSHPQFFDQSSNSLPAILEQMSLKLCEEAKNANSITSSFLIFYSGIAAVTPSPSPATTIAQSPSPILPEQQEKANTEYGGLSQEVATAINNGEGGNINRIQQKLAKAQSDFTWDYRFTYDRAKLAIYGTKTHDEAFTLLYRACEIAIVNGQSNEMLGNLESDKVRHFQRLSHGHNEWEIVNKALKEKTDIPCREYKPIDSKAQQH